MQAVRTVGIRGAGLSGLSLARELLAVRPDLSITILDVRPRLPHPQRTFCFFEGEGSPMTALPTHTWTKVVFRSPTFERHLDVSAKPYTMVRGDDFFDVVLRELEAAGVQFRWACPEVSIERNTISADGTALTFDLAIDAAFRSDTARSMMWQSFAGLWVTAERPTFDPHAAILMDLREGSPEAPVSFLYILPTSTKSALIEHTTFSPLPLAEEYHREHCVAWLLERVGERFEVEAREGGAIPMGLMTSGGQAQHIVVGSAAGTVRPATGYAFLATLRHTREVARQLLSGGAVSVGIYPRWLEGGDRLFLRSLLSSPYCGGQLLEGILSRAPAKALVSFLSAEVSLKDALSVWLCAPKRIMLRGLLGI
jgi:lycopene beta-cyclase